MQILLQPNKIRADRSINTIPLTSESLAYMPTAIRNVGRGYSPGVTTMQLLLRTPIPVPLPRQSPTKRTLTFLPDKLPH
jgi:hypothetical protein